MTDGLKTLIKNQHKRRAQVTAQLQTSFPKRSRKKRSFSSLFYFLIALIFIVGISLIVWDGILVSRPLPSPILQAEESTTTPISEPIPTETEAPLLSQVCTDVPDGQLHVRLAPGEGSAVRGYLAEGETVQFALSMSQKIHFTSRPPPRQVPFRVSCH